MSAHVSRRVFASPFIVTLAACGGPSAPPPNPPQPQQDTITVPCPK